MLRTTPDRLKADPQTPFGKLAILLFAAYLIVGLLVHKDYGVSWDEPVSRLNGVVNYKYLTELLNLPVSDAEVLAAPDLHKWKDKDYGIAFELPLVAFEKISGLNNTQQIYEFRHLATFLYFLLAVLCLYRMVLNRSGDTYLAIFSTLLLALSPRFFAESFYNSKDVIFLASLIITHFFAIRFFRKPTTIHVLLLSMATAFMTDVRIIGILFFAYYGTAMLLTFGIRTSLRWLSLYVIFASVFIVLLFPYLWAAPIDHFAKIIDNMSSFRWRGHVLFDGAYIKSYQLPWYYIPKWMLITIPIPVLAFAVAGVLKTVSHLHRLEFRSRDKLLFEYFATYAIAVPIALILIKRPIMYDGWRQFYFLYFPVLLFAILGMEFLFDRVRTNPLQRYATFTALGIFAIFQMAWMTQNHPFQNVYFNALAGDDLTNQYEQDYWGVGNTSALKYILDHDPSQITISSVSLTPLGNALLMLSDEQKSRVQITHPSKSPKYLITNYRYVRDRSDAPFLGSHEVFHRVVVDGNRIITVYRTRQIP